MNEILFKRIKDLREQINTTEIEIDSLKNMQNSIYTDKYKITIKDTCDNEIKMDLGNWDEITHVLDYLIKEKTDYLKSCKKDYENL